jgi:hypothetical protein
MSDSYKARCYDQWIHCAEAFKSFNLDPYLRTDTDVKVLIPGIVDLYAEIEYRDGMWTVTISLQNPYGLCSAAVDDTLPSAYQLACLRFLGCIIEFEAHGNVPPRVYYPDNLS